MTSTFYHNNKCFLKFSGSDNSIKSVKKELGGEVFSDNNIWDEIRDMKYVFFNQDSTLWKVDTLPYAESLGKSNTLIEWNGARRWFFSDENEQDVWDFFKMQTSKPLILSLRRIQTYLFKILILFLCH